MKMAILKGPSLMGQPGLIARCRMPFWVYGRDRETGKPTEPLFSDATSDTAARAEATEQGMIVERIELHTEADSAGPTAMPRDAAPPASEIPSREERVNEVIAAYLRSAETGRAPDPASWLA